ncbi:MAG: hypothetical protein R2751_19195, partial [Bacteroidales bacterium]
MKTNTTIRNTRRATNLIVLLLLAAAPLLAQETENQDRRGSRNQQRHPGEVMTLFDPRTGSGGYGAISLGYSQINGRDAILMGGRGEWVIGHGFGLGIGGYGFVNDPVAVNELSYSLAGGYGGLVMEP